MMYNPQDEAKPVKLLKKATIYKVPTSKETQESPSSKTNTR
jgi:hypothetical protein